MLSTHRLGRGLLGYLIPFAPHAFVCERQKCPSKLPSLLVFLPILTHFTTTPAIPLTSSILKLCGILGSLWVKPKDLTKNGQSRLETLYTQLFRITLATLVLPLLLARD